MNLQQDTQLKLAFDFVHYTNRNVFLTGKAGTGKTTFLHSLKNSTPKRMVVVAPTGVAAINAGGVTIHSFFQLPFGPIIQEGLKSLNGNSSSETLPGISSTKKFSREKIRLIQCLDLLVIDEISMVRADMLDGIDEVLRKYKDRYKPFGGVQLLLIGDLHQLSPVVKEDEWAILKEYYETVYFFSSKALQKTNPVSIELKFIFRQSDQEFIDILNAVRNNKIDQGVLKKLNERYIPDFVPKEEDGYITLTTHNSIAHEINQTRLKRIKHPSKTFNAVTDGDFPSYAYPTEQNLELKIEAQVMFVKNDSSHDKLYYNGKIGKITRMEKTVIYVKCPSDAIEIPVEMDEWKNVKYTLDEKTKEIKENVIGSFIQFPLKLAWAITIHKSQGLTFDKAIIDANAAFAFGQVYVALSRCRSFEGVVLSSPITQSGIKTDNDISGFTETANKNAPGPQQLLEAKIQLQQSLLQELFEFKKIKNRLFFLKKILSENSNIIEISAINDIAGVEAVAEAEVYGYAEKFRLEIDKLSANNDLPEGNSALQERVKKASVYFAEKLEKIVYKFTLGFIVEIDNKAVQKIINDALEILQKETFVKLQCLKKCVNGFETIAYFQTKANSDIDFKASLKHDVPTEVSVPKNTNHPVLYAELKKWRNKLAEENGIDVYMILPYKTLLQLSSLLPVTLRELGSVKGMGKKKISQFGEEIIDMIAGYCIAYKVERSRIEITHKEKKKKTIVEDSKKQSFDLFKSGKTMVEIAKERGFALSTIEGHMAHYIAIGELDIHSFVSLEKVERISTYLIKNPIALMGEAKTSLGNEVSYSDIRFVMKFLKFTHG